MPRPNLTLAALLLAASAVPAATLGASTASAADLAGETTSAPTPQANPQIDYAAFLALTGELGAVRETHRLNWAKFAARARTGNAILLDTRSASAFAQGHLAGAINLPFSDFTSKSLNAALGADTDRAIYIYCNNNFTDNAAPVVTKKAPLALNIPTFINLHGYGYTNIWELADTVSMDDENVGWVRGAR